MFLRTKTDNPPPLPEVTAAKEAPAVEAAKHAEKPGRAAAPGDRLVARNERLTAAALNGRMPSKGLGILHASLCS